MTSPRRAALWIRVRAEEPRSPVISSTSRRPKVVWPRSLSSTHRADERGPNVFDRKAESLGLGGRGLQLGIEGPDLGAGVFDPGPAVFRLYSVLILFPQSEVTP